MADRTTYQTELAIDTELVSGTIGFLMENNSDESRFRIMVFSPAPSKATNHELGQRRVAQVRLFFEFTRGSKWGTEMPYRWGIKESESEVILNRFLHISLRM